MRTIFIAGSTFFILACWFFGYNLPGVFEHAQKKSDMFFLFTVLTTMFIVSLLSYLAIQLAKLFTQIDWSKK